MMPVEKRRSEAELTSMVGASKLMLEESFQAHADILTFE